MKQTRSLSEFSCLSEYTRLYPNAPMTFAIVFEFSCASYGAILRSLVSLRVLVILNAEWLSEGVSRNGDTVCNHLHI